MNNIRITAISLGFAAMCMASCSPKQEAAFTDTLLLKDYRPVSVLKVPEHHPEAAKFSCIDIHSHPYEKTEEGIRRWLETMDENNIEKVCVLTYAHGEEFDKLYDLYKGVSDRFELWCGFDMSAWGEPDFEQKAVAELERCYAKGAKGVGELGDKGLGERYSGGVPTAHLGDDRFNALLEKCGELHMPVNIHIGDPIWMYEPMDEHNDGYMNSEEWKIDLNTPDILDLYELAADLEVCLDKHPNTTFIACHLMNLSHDYETLAAIMDRHPDNLFVDIAARHIETCITPRATLKFYEKYQDRILFGTDNDPEPSMFDLQWRILETEDEHFYTDDRAYHWPLYGIGIPDDVLHKLYHDNAMKIKAIQDQI